MLLPSQSLSLSLSHSFSLSLFTVPLFYLSLYLPHELSGTARTAQLSLFACRVSLSLSLSLFLPLFFSLSSLSLSLFSLSLSLSLPPFILLSLSPLFLSILLPCLHLSADADHISLSLSQARISAH